MDFYAEHEGKPFFEYVQNSNGISYICRFSIFCHVNLLVLFFHPATFIGDKYVILRDLLHGTVDPNRLSSSIRT